MPATSSDSRASRSSSAANSASSRSCGNPSIRDQSAILYSAVVVPRAGTGDAGQGSA
ncbi:hypothetical protein AB5I41_23315 [Sphingomonas sp. MMS24-JH45]